MRSPLFISFLLSFLLLVTRGSSQNADAFDKHPALLTAHLTDTAQTERQKVRAIFEWVTDNIAYRVNGSRNKSGRPSYTEPEDTGAIRPLDERVAIAVLHNGVAVCDGYARLFKTLCTYAGVESAVIQGYGKTQPFRINQRFNANHSWNAVRIDSTWYLLDVTWASGYLNWQGDEFIRHRDEQYYLTAPAQFIREHYPDDLNWALMQDPPLLPEFKSSPYRHRSFAKYRFTSYSPAKGIIEMQMGDTIQLEMFTPAWLDPLTISSDPFLDTSTYNTSTTALAVPQKTVNGKTSYLFSPASERLQWLYVLFNDDIVLRYRLIIRPRSVDEKGIASDN